MAASTPFQQRVSNGQLTSLDGLPHMDPAIGSAIASYSNSINSNRQSYRWLQALVWIENILFGLGRQWNSDILHSRLSRNTDTGDLAVIANVSKKIPQPTNDFVGRYVETNISLLTENRPQPRITAKSDARDDKQKAELSQLVLDYLWEEHNLPEKHREAARLILYCGIAFMEICYDPTEIRHLAVQQTETEQTTAIPGPDGQPITLPVSRQVPVIDPETGAPKIIGELEYGDIACKLVSPFELHFPQVHSWDEINWVMKENFLPNQAIKDRLEAEGLKKVCIMKNGWDLSVLDNMGAFNVQTLPLWWWERLTTAIEGPGPNIYVGNPELWDDHCVIRTFDRKPCPLWPNGRTIITINDRVLYDSPKDVGARAYDPRWPHRWHPYVRFRWEAQVGSILGRSLVSKLLPKIKRINAIDTALIMWRRTVPMAAWIMPKGTSPIEDLQTGRAGVFFEYDPRKTLGASPQPVPPMPFPAACLEEREFCKNEMEAMAGTEEVLRGQRPEGVNSAIMLDVLRKQALSSRSAIIQAWDESLQVEGSSMLMEVIKHVKNDTRYLERLKILSREKASRFTIDSFSGADLSDNVIVKVDTASQAMGSREAKQARAIEIMQYAPGLIQLPITLQEKLVEDLGWPDTMQPKSQDIIRAKNLLSYIKNNRFDLAVPFPEDDPYVIHDIMVEELKSDAFVDLPLEQQKKVLELIEEYQREIERVERAQLKMQMDMQAAQQEAAAPAAGQPQ